MKEVPYNTVNSWLKANAKVKLEPRRLIPALMRYDITKNEEDKEVLFHLLIFLFPIDLIGLFDWAI